MNWKEISICTVCKDTKCDDVPKKGQHTRRTYRDGGIETLAGYVHECQTNIDFHVPYEKGEVVTSQEFRDKHKRGDFGGIFIGDDFLKYFNKK